MKHELKPSTPQLRKIWRAYWSDWEATLDLWRMRGSPSPAPRQPPLPAQLEGMTCGARTRSGTPCRRRDLYINGRCHLHGGASTGPLTTAGKKRSALNGNLPKSAYPQ